MKQLFRRSIWLSLAAATVVLAISQSAVAQREEGRRERGGEGRGSGRGFGVPLVSLAANDDVQKELKLTDDQKDKIEDLNDELRDEFRKLLESGGQRDGWRALTKSGSEKLTEILDEDQEKRITEIAIQVYGANAVLFHPTLAEHLKVTEEQQEELGDAQRENFRAMGEAWRDMRDQDLSREERRAKFDELRAEADKKLMAVLSDEQQKQLESLKGEKADIDMSQLRPGGRGGRGDRDRDRDRGDRDRDRGDRDRDRDRDDNSEEDASTSS